MKPPFIDTKRIESGLIVVAVLLVIAGFSLRGVLTQNKNVMPAATVTSPYIYSFNSKGVLNEADTMKDSQSRYWWVNSGGQLIVNDDGTGSTMQGDAPQNNRWYQAYLSTNPQDTDQGLHPQNIFRLVSRTEWNNYSEQASFFVTADNFSTSPNRNQSNGLLLFNRYVDGQTLYYAGVRVDGTAVIKKKYHGTYYTMAQDIAFTGTYSGAQDDKNLLPHEQWIMLRDDVATNADGSVTITLYIKKENAADWTKLLEATDRGQFDQTPPILGPGYVGIRTDFMDVKFKTFRVDAL